jgi:YidC/Oxa1 family membrane protein insertase
VDNQRNMILAVVLSALVLIGWTALSDKFLPTARPPATKIEDGKTIALPAPGTPAPAVNAARVQDRAKVIAASPRVPIRTPKLVGTINLTGARIDDLVLVAYRETIKKDSPPIRLLSPGGTADAYYAGSAGPVRASNSPAMPPSGLRRAAHSPHKRPSHCAGRTPRGRPSRSS